MRWLPLHQCATFWFEFSVSFATRPLTSTGRIQQVMQKNKTNP